MSRFIDLCHVWNANTLDWYERIDKHITLSVQLVVTSKEKNDIPWEEELNVYDGVSDGRNKCNVRVDLLLGWYPMEVSKLWDPMSDDK